MSDSDSGSLRAAITNANSDAGDLIVFAGGLSGTITLDTPLPTIGVPMTIAGPGANTVAISGASLSASIAQVNVADNASVAITGLTFEDLNFSGGEGDFGVVVLNTGNLTLNWDAFLNNAVSLDNVPGGGRWYRLARV